MSDKFNQAIEIIENGGAIEIPKNSCTIIIRKIDTFVYETNKKSIYGYDEVEDVTLAEIIQYLAKQDLKKARILTKTELAEKEIKARGDTRGIL